MCIIGLGRWTPRAMLNISAKVLPFRFQKWLFYSILFNFIQFYSILFNSILFKTRCLYGVVSVVLCPLSPSSLSVSTVDTIDIIIVVVVVITITISSSFKSHDFFKLHST